MRMPKATHSYLSPINDARCGHALRRDRQPASMRPDAGRIIRDITGRRRRRRCSGRRRVWIRGRALIRRGQRCGRRRSCGCCRRSGCKRVSRRCRGSEETLAWLWAVAGGVVAVGTRRCRWNRRRRGTGRRCPDGALGVAANDATRNGASASLLRLKASMTWSDSMRILVPRPAITRLVSARPAPLACCWRSISCWTSAMLGKGDPVDPSPGIFTRDEVSTRCFRSIVTGSGIRCADGGMITICPGCRTMESANGP